MDSPRLIVVGSTNTDLVVPVPGLPIRGETVIGGALQRVPGGKGANQAVAAARLGADVTFISRVGDDDFGRLALENLRSSGIHLEHVRVTPGVPSGVALIAVHNQTGDNLIVVSPGANGYLSAADVLAARDKLRNADCVVVSLEIPDDAVVAALNLAAETGTPVILNPAPARRLPPEALSRIQVLTPNEHELALLGGAEHLLAQGVRTIVCTLGASGAQIITREGAHHVPAPRVNAVDTVAAGDCFTGALAVELACGVPLKTAVSFAVGAASLKVTRHGAQPGLPTRSEVLEFLQQSS